MDYIDVYHIIMSIRSLWQIPYQGKGTTTSTQCAGKVPRSPVSTLSPMNISLPSLLSKYSTSPDCMGEYGRERDRRGERERERRGEGEREIEKGGRRETEGGGRERGR